MRRLSCLLALCLTLTSGCSAFVPNSRDELIGRWEGSALFRSATTSMVLIVGRSADSSLVAHLSAPEWLVLEEAVDSLVWEAPRVRFSLPRLDPPLRFEGFARAGRISGRFDSPAFPRLERVESQAKVALRRTASVPPMTSSEHVRLQSSQGDINATLRYPADLLTHPALVLLAVHSSTMQRHQQALADTFARAGWVTLVVDAPVDESAASATVALRWLAAHQRVDGHVGVWVHASAQQIAASLPVGAPLSFVVSVSGVAETGSRVPTLMVRGARDDSRTEASVVETNLPRHHVFPGADHELRLRVRGDEPFEWPRVAPGYIDTLLAWTGRVVGLAPRSAWPDSAVPKLELRPGWR